MSLVNAIGVISGLLGIVGFFQDLLPQAGPDPDRGATITIKVGLEPGDANDELGGVIGSAFAFNVENNFLGIAEGLAIGPGGREDIIIPQNVPGQRAEFVGVSAETDAVCIAWLTVQNYDGTAGAAWTGDNGFSCGQNWYMQTEFAGYLNQAEMKDDYIPRCTWLDADGTNGIPSGALKFRARSFGAEVTDTVNNACAATIYGRDDGPINERPGKRDLTPSLSSVTSPLPLAPWMLERLIVSNITSHSAAELCNSVTSWGPDMVGADGMFCDMTTRVLSPLCDVDDVDGCMALVRNSGTITKRSTIARRAVHFEHKTYQKISNWAVTH